MNSSPYLVIVIPIALLVGCSILAAYLKGALSFDFGWAAKLKIFARDFGQKSGRRAREWILREINSSSFSRIRKPLLVVGSVCAFYGCVYLAIQTPDPVELKEIPAWVPADMRKDGRRAFLVKKGGSSPPLVPDAVVCQQAPGRVVLYHVGRSDYRDEWPAGKDIPVPRGVRYFTVGARADFIIYAAPYTGPK